MDRMDSETHITHLTHAPGDPAHTDGLGVTFGLIYSELEHIARQLMLREQAGHTLGTVGVVHETYLRMLRTYVDKQGDKALSVDSMRAICARVMRHVLVDHARKRGARRRADDEFAHQLERGIEQLEPAVIDILALDKALKDLERLDERKARVVELRFFSGMAMRQIADLLDIPLRSVERDWSFSRAWLRMRIEGASGES